MKDTYNVSKFGIEKELFALRSSNGEIRWIPGRANATRFTKQAAAKLADLYAGRVRKVGQ